MRDPRALSRYATLLVAAVLAACGQPAPPPTLPAPPLPSQAPTAPASTPNPATDPGDSVGATNGPTFSALELSARSVALYEPLEIAFDIAGSAATRPDFPYDPDPPPGLAGRVGITVEGQFLPPGETDWSHAQTQPGFRYQAFQRVVDSTGAEGLVPVGEASWRLRFTPTVPGAWQVRVRAQDAAVCPIGSAPCTTWVETPSAAFEATPALPGRHGFVRVSAADPRYFEYSDGTYFRVAGFQAPIGTNTDVDAEFARYADNGITLVRSWMSATSVFSRGFPQWSAWANSELDFTVHAPDKDLSARLDAGAPTACMFQGFGESARPAFFAGRSYRLTVRARLVGVTEALDPARPFGLAVRLGGWPKDVCTSVEPNAQYLSPYWTGDGDWAEYTATFSVPRDVVLNGAAFFTVALENAASGAAYIDTVSVVESAGGSNILPHGDLNDHLGFDQAASWRWDRILEAAAEHGLTLKLVVLEKQDSILGFFRPDGSLAPERDDANFYGLPGVESKVRRLQAYYWRYLTARWGFSTAVHSWELLNEGDPFNGNHYDLANNLARTVHAEDPNRHLVTTSFWHSFPVREFWGNPAYPDLDYADFHAYVDTTWLIPDDVGALAGSTGCGQDVDCFRAALTGDSALYHLAHSVVVQAAGLRMPVVRGEGALTLPGSGQVPDPDLARDVNGVWLHKFLFAQLAPGALQELYWYTEEIRANNLFGVYARYRDFLAGVALNSGAWQDAHPDVQGGPVRVVGQVERDMDRALLWVDHPANTWKAVVAGQAALPVTARVRVGGFTPGAALAVEWWDLCSGAAPTCRISVARREQLTADGAGEVTLDVRDLTTDLGVKIAAQAP